MTKGKGRRGDPLRLVSESERPSTVECSRIGRRLEWEVEVVREGCLAPGVDFL